MTRPEMTSLADPDLRRLNAVRLLAVLAIGLGYASTMPQGPESREWLSHLGHDPSWFGVQVLFFLSGWLGWRSLSRTDHRRYTGYLARRAKRIYPWTILYTAAIVLVAYPLLCAADDKPIQPAAESLLYFVKTASLIAPGDPMPGALDSSPYTCLLQGAIWTLRWGIVAHIGLISVYALRIRSRTGLSILAVLAVLLCASIFLVQAKTALDLPAILGTGARLAYPFLAGAALYAWDAKQMMSRKRWFTIAALAFGIATIHYLAVPWTPAIEILATTGWCAVAMMLLKPAVQPTASDARPAPDFLAGRPNLILPTYLGIWPICQIYLFAAPHLPTLALIAVTLLSSVALAAVLSALARTLRIHRRIQPA